MDRPRRKNQTAESSDSATIATRIADMIQQDIIRGNLVAGERLNEVALAKRYGVSRIPLREALRIVEGLGLLEIRAFSGASVAELSIAEIVDIFEVHEALETVAVRLAVPLLTEEDLRLAEKVARKFEREPDPWQSLELANEFYTVLYSCIGRKHLLNELRRIVSHEDRYVFALFAAMRMFSPNLPRQRDFIEVLRKRDVNKAIKFQQDWRRAQRDFLIQHIGTFPKTRQTSATRKLAPKKTASKLR